MPDLSVAMELEESASVLKTVKQKTGDFAKKNGAAPKFFPDTLASTVAYLYGKNIGVAQLEALQRRLDQINQNLAQEPIEVVIDEVHLETGTLKGFVRTDQGKSLPLSASSSMKDLSERFNFLLDSFLSALKNSVGQSPDYYKERWRDGLFVDEIETPLGKMQIIQRHPRNPMFSDQYSIFHEGQQVEEDQEQGLEGFNFVLGENALRVSMLYLRPEYQDKGVGASIVKWLARYALKNKKEWLRNTYTHNPRIIHIFSEVMIPETIVIKELDISGRETGKQYTYDEFLAKFGNKKDSKLSGSWSYPLQIVGKPDPNLVKKGSSPLGGIDFDSSKLNLQIRRDGRGVPLPLPQQDLENIDIKGLYPVIINILPVNPQTLPILGQLQIWPDVVLSKG